MLALKLGKERGEIDETQMVSHLKAMREVPNQLREVLQQKEKVCSWPRACQLSESMAGRGTHGCSEASLRRLHAFALRCGSARLQ